MQNIVSGQEMVNDKELYHILGDIIPFNEAMVEGSASKIIFSKSFIEDRCKSLNVTIKMYEDVVLNNVKRIDLNDDISLYFGDDMFCQINCLTMLAYLQQSNYNKIVTINICDEHKKEIIDRLTISVDGFVDEYDAIILNKKKINSKLKYLNKVIDLYFLFSNKDREYLKTLYDENNFKNINEIVSYLLKTYPQFGMGDIQWISWIKSKIECS